MLLWIVRPGPASPLRIPFRHCPPTLPDLISPCASASTTTPTRLIWSSAGDGPRPNRFPPRNNQIVNRMICRPERTAAEAEGGVRGVGALDDFRLTRARILTSENHPRFLRLPASSLRSAVSR